MFKGVVLDYAREHDVPLADIAGALGVLARDGQDFLLAPDPPARRESRRPEPERAPRTRPQRKPAQGAQQKSFGKPGKGAQQKASGKPAQSAQQKPYGKSGGKSHGKPPAKSGAPTPRGRDRHR
jgi:hypothetical protein